MIKILIGDCREVLKTLPDASVNCCVTSPPYWGLRDYGHAGQIGMEKTPGEFVENMVEVFREVRRVLTDDGTLWLNLGDSYASGKGTCFNPGGGESSLGKDRKEAGAHPLDRGNKSTLAAVGLKPKDLVGIPWRVAFALQADGWWLRSDIVWAKPNPMPESVTDRPTKSHEYIFLLSKNKRYYYDAEAIKEEGAQNKWGKYSNPKYGNVLNLGGKMQSAKDLSKDEYLDKYKTVNKHTVWTVATQPFPGSHFAVFPEKLIEPCILAGTSEKGCCPDCGAPWRRVVEKTGHINNREPAHCPNNTQTKIDSTGWAPTTRPTDKWQPGCSCGKDPIPCTVMDPFFGSGTTGIVANKYGRKFIGIDLSLKYILDIAIPRIERKTKQRKLF